MLGGIPRRWVHVCIAKRNLLDISEIHARLPVYQPSRGFLMHPTWSSGGQDVHEGDLYRFLSVSAGQEGGSRLLKT